MKKFNVRWPLIVYDLLILWGVQALLLIFYKHQPLTVPGIAGQILLTTACVFIARLAGRIYMQVWRYGGIQCYIRLLVTDGVAFVANLILENFLAENVPVSRLLAICCMNLLGALSIRMIYRYAYKCGNTTTVYGKFLTMLLRLFGGSDVVHEQKEKDNGIRVAIIGAGRNGVALADELLNNEESIYEPRCFVDVSKEKADRTIHGIPVLLENEVTIAHLKDMEIQEVVFALPHLSEEEKKALCDRYLNAGYRIRVYDYPVMQAAGNKRQMRDFDVTELLFRKPVEFHEEKTAAYYQDKVVLITGGGGSIGSELCRQLSKMKPKKVVVLDIYENGAYDVQQELKIAYGKELDLQIEIASICNRKSMERVFRAHKPQIVINAAAHKHVPLMEHNCIEAVENNVFGTKILVELCEEYGVESL